MSDNCEKERLLGGSCSCGILDKNSKPFQCHDKDEFDDKVDRQSYLEADGSKRKSRTRNICKGANRLQQKIVSEQTKLIFLVSGVAILLMVFLALAAAYILMFNRLNMHQKIIQKTVSSVQKRNALCKEVTTQNATLFLRGEIDAATHKAQKYVDPRKNVFYAIDQPLTKEQACSIESVLRLLPDKLVYVIELDDEGVEKNCNGIDYITFLQKLYINLNRIRTTKRHFFEGTLLGGCWDAVDDSLSSFSARILAVWQFGGAALSENLLMNSRYIFDRTNKSCLADRDLVYCPRECSVYCYNLLKNIKDTMKQTPANTNMNSTDFENLIDGSIKLICADDRSKGTCDYVCKMQQSEMCEGNSACDCHFVRLEKLQKMDQNKVLMKEFCHYIGRSF